jgi:hypothetical protein
MTGFVAVDALIVGGDRNMNSFDGTRVEYLIKEYVLDIYRLKTSVKTKNIIKLSLRYSKIADHLRIAMIVVAWDYRYYMAMDGSPLSHGWTHG